MTWQLLPQELRERTGAGMMECKKMLTETNGDIDAAIEELRKRGAAQADKKAGRIAAEGTIVTLVDGNKGVAVEVNSETDFSAKNEGFMAFANKVATSALNAQPENIEALANVEVEGGQTVEAARQTLIQEIGENITVRRFEIVEAGAAKN